MYKNVYGYISPLLQLSVKPENVTRIFFFFYNCHINFLFYRCGEHLYITLKESKSTNYIIFFDYSTGIKIIVPENFDFQY